MVYDITNPRSFDALNNWKQEFLRQAAPKNVEQFPFVLIGNKVDRETERKVPKAKALSWCKQNGDIPYYEASAKDETNVKDAFEMAARLSLRNQSTAM